LDVITKECRYKLIEELGWKLESVNDASWWQRLTSTPIVNLEDGEYLLIAQREYVKRGYSGRAKGPVQ
jgi:hypothetical protein